MIGDSLFNLVNHLIIIDTISIYKKLQNLSDLRPCNEIEASLIAARRTLVSGANHLNEDDDNKFYDFTIFTVDPSGIRKTELAGSF